MSLTHIGRLAIIETSICRNSVNKNFFFVQWSSETKWHFKIHLYIVRTGRSRSGRTVTIECSPQVSQGPSRGSPCVIRGVFARGDSLGDPVSLSLSQHLDSLSGDPAETMWGMISLSSKGLFSSPRDSFAGQLNLSWALVITAGVSGGNMGQLASGGVV